MKTSRPLLFLVGFFACTSNIIIMGSADDSVLGSINNMLKNLSADRATMQNSLKDNIQALVNINQELSAFNGRPQSSIALYAIRLSALLLGVYLGTKTYKKLISFFISQPNTMALAELSHKMGLEIHQKMERLNTLVQLIAQERDMAKRTALQREYDELEAYFVSINEMLKKQNSVLDNYQKTESSLITNMSRWGAWLGAVSLGTIAIKSIITQILQKHPHYNPLTPEETATINQLKNEKGQILKDSEFKKEQLLALKGKKEELRKQKLIATQNTLPEVARNLPSIQSPSPTENAIFVAIHNPGFNL